MTVGVFEQAKAAILALVEQGNLGGNIKDVRLGAGCRAIGKRLVFSRACPLATHSARPKTRVRRQARIRPQPCDRRRLHESFPLLKECPEINFIGSVESRGITEGIADVAVCDGFTGNIILKSFEGVAAIMLKVIKGAMMKNIRTKIGAALMKSELKKSLELFSVEEYGGAPMLGIKKLVVKTHGNSKAPEIRNTILQCSKAVTEDLTGKIERTFYGI